LSDFSQLLIGITLALIGIGSVTICVPRRGKMAWFVGKPFLEPGVPILIITTFAIGIILIAAYFTTIDSPTLAGVVTHS
jgi:hypothetical protein